MMISLPQAVCEDRGESMLQGSTPSVAPLGLNPKSLKALFAELVWSLWYQPFSFQAHAKAVKALLLFSFERLGIALFMAAITMLPRLFVRVKVIGRENVARSGRVLYLINHPSYAGTFMVQGYMFAPWVIWNPLMYPINIAKAKHVNAFGHWLRCLAIHYGIHPLEKKGPKRALTAAMMIDALRHRAGLSLVLFPTGTRERQRKELGSFQAGIGRIIAAASPTIVFVWDDNSQDIRLRLPLWYRPLVTIRISKPLVVNNSEAIRQLSELPKDKQGAAIAEHTRKLFLGWVGSFDAEVRQRYGAAPEIVEDLRSLL